MVHVVVLVGTGPRSLVPLSISKPVSLFELSLQFSRIAELLMAVTVRPLGAVGTVGVVVHAYGVHAECPAELNA